MILACFQPLNDRTENVTVDRCIAQRKLEIKIRRKQHRSQAILSVFYALNIAIALKQINYSIRRVKYDCHCEQRPCTDSMLSTLMHAMRKNNNKEMLSNFCLQLRSPFEEWPRSNSIKKTPKFVFAEHRKTNINVLLSCSVYFQMVTHQCIIHRVEYLKTTYSIA